MLIAHIDILHGPNDGNFQLFCQAKRSLQSVMDMILESLDPGQSETSRRLAGFAGLDGLGSDCGFYGDFWYVNSHPNTIRSS